MDSNTAIMLAALLINFLTMLIGGIKILSVTVKYHVEQERRMVTIEQQIIWLMKAANMKVGAI